MFNIKFKFISLRTKIVAISATLALVIFGLSFGYLLSKTQVQLVNQLSETIELNVYLEHQLIENNLHNILDGIFVIEKHPPIQGIINTKKKGDVDGYERWRQRLSVIFSSEIDINNVYNQLRYIDNNGDEIVRVELDNNTSTIIPDADLSNKSARDYLLNSHDLLSGEVFVSNIELNREGEPAVISKPYTPVLRYIIPIFDYVTGKRAASLVANISVTDLFNVFPESENGVDSFIIDPQGYYLTHNNPAKKWGSPIDLDTGENFKLDFPEIFEEFKKKNRGILDFNGDIFVFSKIPLDDKNPDNFLTLVNQGHKKLLFSPINAIIQNSIILSIITFIVLLFGFIFLMRALLLPLEKLTVIAGRIGEGNFDEKIEDISNDEIGSLSTALNTMMQKLKGLYSDLSVKVKEKTGELADKVEELEKTKYAMINVLDDVDDAKNIAEIEEKKTKAILESIGDGLIVFDADGCISLINKSCEYLLGVTHADAVGKRKNDIVKTINKEGEVVLDDYFSSRKDTYVEGEVFEYEKINGKRLFVAVTFSPIIFDDKNLGAVEVFRDISKEKQIDRAKTEFVSLASHQLRTPLTAIRWYIEMLLGGDAGPITEDQIDYLREIDTGNNRMIDLVNSLLNVSRIELGNFAVDPVMLNVQDLIRSIIREFKPLVQDRPLEIILHDDKAPVKYLGDEKLLTMIFQNLISNAIKYTQKGAITLNFDVDESNLIFTISDTGCGIPDDSKEYIFTKLFRADNVKSQDTTGTGLGLYIIKSIVAEVDGRIWFDSEEDKGTTFHVTLPLSGMNGKEGSKPLE